MKIEKFLEANLVKQVRIIEYLAVYSTTTFSELCLAIDISENTLRTYIKNIYNQLPKNWGLTTEKKIDFYKPTNETLAILKIRIWKDSAFLQLILFLIKNERTSILEICKTFHISKEFAYRLLKYLSDILSLYKLQLNKKPVRIVGSEVAIRYFLFDVLQFFLSNESWHLNSLFTDNIFSHPIESIIDSIESQLNITIPKKYKFDYILYLTIALYRNEFNCNLSFDPEIASVLKNTIELKIATTILSKITFWFPKITLSIEQVYFVTLPLVINLDISKHIKTKDLTAREQLTSIFKLDKIIDYFINSCITEFSLSINSPLVYHLLYERFKIFILKRLLNYNSNGLFQIPDIPREYLERLKTIYQTLNHFFIPKDIFSIDYYELYSILRLERILHERKKEILILMSGGELVEQKLKLILSKIWGYSYNFIINSEINYSITDYYAVISDIHTTDISFQKELICISSYVSPKDLSLISTFFLKEAQELQKLLR